MMQQQKQTYTIKTFDIGPMQNLIYVITDNDTKESAIVDPAWDMTEIYEYLNNNNLILKKILLTHSHNDHVNAVDEVLDKFDTQIHINKKEKVFWAKDYDNFSINYGGDIIYLGGTQIKSLHTPGHTPGSTCYYIGNNLIALKSLVPDIKLDAIEINPIAKSRLEEIVPNKNIFEGSIIDYKPKKRFDLVLIKGVLIHLNPEYLQDVYMKLFQSSTKYILLAEYYNPTPVEIEYRGFRDKLFKRDFAGEILAKYSELSLIDYGFCYHGDKLFPNSDFNWFLMEK